MTMRKTLVLLLLLIFMIAVHVAGCGDDKKPAEQPKSNGTSGILMIYTSIFPDVVELVKPAIAKKFPELKVNWFLASSEQIMAKLDREIESKKIQADLLLVADQPYYLTLKDKGLLLKYDSPMRKKIVENKDREGYWTGVRINSIVIAYNTNKVKPEEAPESWQGLLNPKWNGKSRWSPAAFRRCVCWRRRMVQNNGWEYFEN